MTTGRAPAAAGIGRRPLRVLFPASLWPGGAERQMLLLTANLPRERFEVTFVLLGGETPLAEDARTAGARVHALGAPRRAGVSMPVFGARVGARTVDYIRFCRRERFDIVDAWLFLGYGLAAITDPLTRIPVMISGRRSLSGFKAGFGPVERAIDALARRTTDAFVANSHAVADDVAAREGIARHRIRVIHNGVELPALLDEGRRHEIRAAWRIPPEAPVIGVVGTFKEGKGQARVVGMLPGILDAVPDARLVLLGDGPLRTGIEHQVSSLGLETRVVITGQVADARPLYGAFDVVASASDAEGLPNAVLEAAAAGVAVAATDAGGTREVVLDGDTGLLVPVGDEQALGRALVRLLERPDERARLGAAARAHAAREFGVDRFVAETSALYEALAAGRARGWPARAQAAATPAIDAQGQPDDDDPDQQLERFMEEQR